MEKNQEDKKGINLMPEDLRSKESGILTKIKSKADFDFDFVSPESSSLEKKSKQSGPSFWNKIKKAFNKPKRFGEANAKVKKQAVNTGERAKIIYNPGQKKIEELQEKEPILHIPKKQENKQLKNFSANYKDSILGDTKKPEPQAVNKIFESKTTAPKIESVPAKAIVAQDTKESKPIDILDKKNIEAIPEIPVQNKIEDKKKEEKPKKQGLSFWDKFKKLFSSKAKIEKGSKIESVPAKVIIAQDTENKVQKNIPQLSQLDKDKIKSKPEFLHKVEKDIEVKKDHKKQGLSFWDKFKKLFSSKAKIEKGPKIESVPAKAIVAQDTKESKRIDILDKKNIEAIPEIPVQNKIEDKKKEEKSGADFSMPIMGDLAEKTEANKKIDSTKKKSKFHQPQPRIRARLLSDGGGVDLIPDSAKTRSWRQIINLLLLACLGTGFIVALFYSFLFYQDKNIKDQKDNRADQITSLERHIIEYKGINEDITLLGKEIKSIHKLLSFHFYWTNFFQLLEKYTVEGVYYSGLTAGNGGALTLSATASDFDTLARQIKVLEQEDAIEFVTSVNVSAATYNEESANVSFSMTIVLGPSLFKYNEDYIYEIKDELSDEEE